ncbi:M48 family metallopeptidase [Flammeovirga sp. SJP92]|uniref:M48 family metallopeptidase n=1 Tax=Flammeovirga sp. SJP92 TaxID=1775430 RepID=UPI000792D315|nr:M48 family metallopeptidase [Flammeovirga sp. SJP92]KXX72356.1 hypothetical protein AVL50_01770 [Flammeovirga sp. SJP92]
MYQYKEPSHFKSLRYKTIASLFLFFVSYAVLLALASGLALFSIYCGYHLMTLKPMFIFIPLSFGVIGFGVLVFLFLLKFILIKNVVDTTLYILANRENEPRLFDMIDEIVNELGTALPNKVKITSEVGASVSIKSNIWNIFFRKKKDLHIGLGLINAVSEKELKAVLSHEFGHFAQSNSNIDIIVINANQLIYNLLYDNGSFEAFVQYFSDIHAFFAFFTNMAYRVIRAIKYLLSKIYSILNKSHMKLTREREYEADKIACSITGYEPLKATLYRFDFINGALESVYGLYQKKSEQKLKSENLFKEHQFVIEYASKEGQIKLSNSIPHIDKNTFSKFNYSKLSFEDQWDSHPSIDDRVSRISNYAPSIGEEEKYIPANSIISKLESYQKALTEKTFEGLDKEEAEVISLEQFKELFVIENNKYIHPGLFNNYYNEKNPSEFVILDVETPQEDLNFKDLYSDQKVKLVYNAISLQSDIERLYQIKNGFIDVITFDYDGKRYAQKECDTLIQTLTDEFKGKEKEIRKNDVAIYTYLKSKTDNVKALEKIYTDFFEDQKYYYSKMQTLEKAYQSLQVVHYNTSFDEIENVFREFEYQEGEMKEDLQHLLENDLLKESLRKDTVDFFNYYLSKDWTYYAMENYYQQNLSMLFNIMELYPNVLNEWYIMKKRAFLDFHVNEFSKTENIQFA